MSDIQYKILVNPTDFRLGVDKNAKLIVYILFLTQRMQEVDILETRVLFITTVY